nr:hypothetical protein [uncultured Dongia sp.]
MSQEVSSPATDGQFRVSKVLSTSLSVLGHNAVPFILITIIVQLPTLLAQLFLDPNFATDPGTVVVPELGSTFAYLGLLMVISAVTNGLTSAALIYGSFQDLRGQKVGLGECFARAIAVLPAVVIASLVLGILVGIGTVLLIVPGVIFYVVFWLYAPAIVAEKKGISEAFARSRELTKGKRWQIFAILLIIFIGLFIVDYVIGAVLGSALGAVAIATTVYVVNSAIGAYMAVAVAVTYYYLRADKEGVDIEDIAKLFD